MNRRQRRVVATVVSILTAASVLHGIDSGSVLFVLAAPALLVGGFLYLLYGQENDAVAVQRFEPKRRWMVLLSLSGAAVVLFAVVLVGSLAEQAPTPTNFEERLTAEELASVQGTLQMSGSDLEVNIYNGTTRSITSAVVYVSIYRAGEQVLSRRYLLTPFSPPFGIPPLSVGQLRADAGFYRLFTDSLAWSFLEARAR